MVNHFIQYIAILTTVLLLAFTTSASAMDSGEILINTESPNAASEYQHQLLFQLINTYNPSLNLQQRELVCRTILTEAQKTDFDPFFISSIIAAESSFRPRAVSPCKALGLMQLTSCVSKAMRIRNPFNIQENIYAGTRFLQYLKEQFHDSTLVLAAYNAGPTRVSHLGRVPRIRETILYIRRVNSLYMNLRQDFLALLKNSLSQLQLCQTLKDITRTGHSIQFAVYVPSATSAHYWISNCYIYKEPQSRIFIQA